MEEIEFSQWLFEGRLRQCKNVLPDGLNWRRYFASSSKSHPENSISFIFLESPHQVDHQVDMKNIVESSTHFFGYFNTLETQSATRRFPEFFRENVAQPLFGILGCYCYCPGPYLYCSSDDGGATQATAARRRQWQWRAGSGAVVKARLLFGLMGCKKLISKSWLLLAGPLLSFSFCSTTKVYCR